MARIRNAGMEVSAGFIVGFDNDDITIFEDQYRFIQDNGILLAMVGMLTAVPKTPLYERLEKTGRLRLDDEDVVLLPLQAAPQALSDQRLVIYRPPGGSTRGCLFGTHNAPLLRNVRRRRKFTRRPRRINVVNQLRGR